MTLLSKYAPTKLSEFVFEDSLVEVAIRPFATGATRDNILLYGDFGGGKSTLAQIVANAGFHRVGTGNKATVLAGGKYNATSHDLLDNGWMLGSIDGIAYPYVIIEDVDRLKEKQLDLRDFLDGRRQYGVIFTTNSPGLVDGGLLNRCQQFELKVPSPAQWAPRAQYILAQEGVSVSLPKVQALLTAANGSIRDIERALAQLIASVKAV
tara:strand:+ start:8259 stop:8885 length:627 start_codon:yes stop_codon:yes gene_type:complete